MPAAVLFQTKTNERSSTNSSFLRHPLRSLQDIKKKSLLGFKKGTSSSSSSSFLYFSGFWPTQRQRQQLQCGRSRDGGGGGVAGRGNVLDAAAAFKKPETASKKFVEPLAGQREEREGCQHRLAADYSSEITVLKKTRVRKHNE